MHLPIFYYLILKYYSDPYQIQILAHLKEVTQHYFKYFIVDIPGKGDFNKNDLYSWHTVLNVIIYSNWKYLEKPKKRKMKTEYLVRPSWSRVKFQLWFSINTIEYAALHRGKFSPKKCHFWLKPPMSFRAFINSNNF